jgi:hypothetical protein
MVGRDWSGTAGDADGGTLGGRRRAACERRRRARPTRGAAHGPAYSAHEIRAQVLGTGWVCVVSVARKARFCRYCSDRLAAPSSVSRPRGSRRSQPRSTKGIPAVRILSVPESNSASGPSVPVHPRHGRCLRSEFSPRDQTRPGRTSGRRSGGVQTRNCGLSRPERR